MPPSGRCAAGRFRRGRGLRADAGVQPVPGGLRGWRDDWRQLLMEDFYRVERHRLDLLLEGDRPVGGRWTFDEENREPPARGAQGSSVPLPYRPRRTRSTRGARRPRPLGHLEGAPRSATTARGCSRSPGARRWRRCSDFLDTRLGAFGPHEDAMLRDERWLAHSLLSRRSTSGCSTRSRSSTGPSSDTATGDAPLASTASRASSARSWAGATTSGTCTGTSARTPAAQLLAAPGGRARMAGPPRRRAVEAACLSDVLAGPARRRLGAPHPAAHGPRQLRAQRGIDPSAMTDWFQTRFVDGYEWVMVANVVGMSQHADGGRWRPSRTPPVAPTSTG